MFQWRSTLWKMIFLDFGEDPDRLSSSNTFSRSKAKAQAEIIMMRYFKDPQMHCKMHQNYPTILQIFGKFNASLQWKCSNGETFLVCNNTPKSNRLNDEKFEIRVILNSIFNS